MVKFVWKIKRVWKRAPVKATTVPGSLGFSCFVAAFAVWFSFVKARFFCCCVLCRGGIMLCLQTTTYHRLYLGMHRLSESLSTLRSVHAWCTRCSCFSSLSLGGDFTLNTITPYMDLSPHVGWRNRAEREHTQKIPTAHCGGMFTHMPMMSVST